MIHVHVFCKLRFEAEHRWRDAPDSVPFLRSYHRHEFHVKLGREVQELNREIEFITLKRDVKKWIDDHWTNEKLHLSCEQMAHELRRQFQACYVEVSEDGENGAVVMEVK